MQHFMLIDFVQCFGHINQTGCYNIIETRSCDIYNDQSSSYSCSHSPVGPLKSVNDSLGDFKSLVAVDFSRANWRSRAYSFSSRERL